MLNARTSLRWQLWGAFTVIVALAAGAGVWLADELRDGERQPVAAATADIARIAPRGGAQTVTVQKSFTLTLTQPASGALTASPEATTYKKDASVTVTATPRAGYRLKAWGGDCAGTPASSPTCTLTMNANKTVSATFALASAPPAPVLIVVDVGEAGVLVLEWTPDPDSISPTHGVTGWQYRQRARQGGTTDGPWVWGEWTNVPGSAADTRSYRLTGLPLRAFYFEVRAVAGTLAGRASETVEGLAPIIGADGIPHMTWGQISEGGRTWRLSAGPTVITIPAGTRLILEGGGLQGGLVTVSFRDVESGSWQIVDIGTGDDLGREIIAARPASNGKGTDAATERRDVGAIFDKIMASARIIEP